MSAICKQRTRHSGAAAAALLLCAFLLIPLRGCSGLRRFSVTYADVFDTVTTFTAYAGSQADFDALAERLHSLLEEEHRRFDIYREYDGEVNLCTVNRLAASGPVSVDGEIMELLRFGVDVYGFSHGKVNIAMGSVLSLWQEAREKAAADPASAAAPDFSLLREAAEHCSMDELELDPDNGTVRFLDPKLQLDVGALAKGWAQARAMELLEQSGCRAWLLNMGGSVSCRGVKPDGSPWVVGLEDPLDKSSPMQTFTLSDSCAVTSGVDQRFFLAGGVRYHHLIDPDTSRPGDRFTQVTVLLPDPTLADALSTALFLLDREAGAALAESLGAQAFWVLPDGSTAQTAGFPPLN